MHVPSPSGPLRKSVKRHFYMPVIETNKSPDIALNILITKKGRYPNGP